jgi:site-specific DNA-methyltransferase (adenine-specific)
MKAYYQDYYVTIYHGDCREILPELPKVDLVFTDPPYSTPVMTAFGRKHVKNYGDLSIQRYYLETLEKDLKTVLRASGAILFHCDDAYAGILYATFYHWHICQYLIWDKGRIGMGRPFRRQHEFLLFATQAENFEFDSGKTLSTVLAYSPVVTEQRLHGAEKPIDLTCDLILALTDRDGLILDPFLGSGTTAFAAKKLNRKCIGIEIEEKYCEIAANRCRQEVFDLTA